MISTSHNTNKGRYSACVPSLLPSNYILMKHQPSKVISVEGLPTPVAQMLRAMVRTLRDQLRSAPRSTKSRSLPTWPGTVKGKMTRNEIYEDVG